MIIPQAVMRTAMTQFLRRINEHLSTDGQPTEAELQQLAAEGFKSVLNLRTPGEVNSIQEAQQQVETLGLVYAHVPLSKVVDAEKLQEAVQQVQALPKALHNRE